MGKRVNLENFNKQSRSSPCPEVVLPPDLQVVKDKLYATYLEQYGLDIPGYALRPLVEAMMAPLGDKPELIEKARQGFELCYLAAWCKGAIRREEDVVPMPEEVKVTLRNINERRREERNANKKGAKEVKRMIASAKPKGPKLPVFQDKVKQAEVKAKYAWVIAGSFKQDSEKAGGTNVDIKCQKCSASRTIHLADAFQVKLCLDCKKAK